MSGLATGRVMPEQSRPKQAHIWQRDPHDWFVEPQRVTEALLSVERFVDWTWDPACGGGNICEAFIAAGRPIHGTDVVKRCGSKLWWRGERDFLKDAWLPVGATNVVTNPPYFRALGTESFIRRALEGASGKVAVFADLRFLASRRRAEGIYTERPPHRIWMVADRPSCPPGAYLEAGNVAAGGTADFCWLVWDLTAPPVTASQLGWLR